MSAFEKRPAPLRLRVGSRDSKLAVIQSRLVMEAIRRLHPEAELELVTMKTSGDLTLDRPLEQIGGKGLFVKELDQALLTGRVDLTVHSLKDLPTGENPLLPLVIYGRREDPRDCLVLPSGTENPAGVPEAGKPLGCGSRRRGLQLAALYPGCHTEPVRGNVLTRLRKLDEGQFGGLILAAAGLKRLGLASRITRCFEPEDMLPAACQGMIAAQTRQDLIDRWDARCGGPGSFFAGFSDPAVTAAALAERAFIRTLDGGCGTPCAAFATVRGDSLRLRGLYWHEPTDSWQVDCLEGRREDGVRLAVELARRLRAAFRAAESEP